MRHLILFIVITAISLISFAQSAAESSNHLTFKGVPIDGTLAQFVAKMKANGFVNTRTNNGTAVLEGDFASYKDCSVRVSTLTGKDLVSKIAVIFPEREDWSSLESNYLNLKDLLTEKYGEPSSSVEKFQSYTPTDDRGKFTSVQLGSCQYLTTYETTKGTIQLSIKNDGAIRCFVNLGYFDKINGESVKKQALDDL